MHIPQRRKSLDNTYIHIHSSPSSSFSYEGAVMSLTGTDSWLLTDAHGRTFIRHRIRSAVPLAGPLISGWQPTLASRQCTSFPRYRRSKPYGLVGQHGLTVHGEVLKYGGGHGQRRARVWWSCRLPPLCSHYTCFMMVVPGR